MKAVQFLTLAILLVACGTSKKSVSETGGETNTSTAKPERNIQLIAETGDFVESDPFDILAVRREGNLLFVDISFMGGCGVHDFKVIGHKAVMKSMPPKRSIMIAHSVPREECNDLVKKTLEIDISALAPSQTVGSEINLILKDWDEEINYIFE